MNLLEKLKQLPNDAGVYQYFDKDGHLLYIGKAKVLKNRVKSYFKFTPKLLPADKLGPRIYKMISEVVSCEWIVVPNEHDALILENSLIKQLKPKYNILLRDDKTYPYIVIDYNQDFPRLEITRRILKEKNVKYFGPYSTGAKDMLDSIYEIVPLVQKKSCVSGKKACLFHQIQKCLAPCENKISKEDYAKIVETALEYIYNKSKLITKLNERMSQYANDFRFEEAMTLRDRIKTIEKSQIKSGIDLATNEDIDIFAITASNKKAVVVRMFLRDGKLASSSHDFLKVNNFDENFDFDYNEAYKRAIINYYDNEIPLLPKEILTGIELEDVEELEDFLQTRFSKKIKVLNPKKDKKKDIVQIALNNCDELLRIDSSRNQTTIYEELKDLFGLQTLPYLIESYDNSHMMGQATGNIKVFQIVICIIMLCELPFSYFILYTGGKPYMVMYPSIFVISIGLFARFLILKKISPFYKLRHFTFNVFCRNILIAIVCYYISFKIKTSFFFCDFISFLLMSFIAFIVSCLIIYVIGFSPEERNALLNFIKNKIRKR